MKCPKCGAQLQENAQFCFYCMHSLTDREPVDPKKGSKKTKKWLLWTAVAVATVGALIAVFFYIKSVTGPKEQDPIIATFDDFQLRATYLTGKEGLSGLWDPDGLQQTYTGTDRQGDTWQIYAADVFLDDVNFCACFCEGGTEIILSLTDLTEENMDEGLQIVECAIYSVYNYTFTNLHDILTDHDRYPAQDIEPDEQILVLANLPDPSGEKQDPGTQSTIIRKCVLAQSDQLMYVEIRTRTYEGTVYYDIVILHTIRV